MPTGQPGLDNPSLRLSSRMVLKLTKLTTTQGPSLNLKVTHLHPPPQGWGYTRMLTWLALMWVLGI